MILANRTTASSFATRTQEKGLVKPNRRDAGQTLRETDERRNEHPTEKMIKMLRMIRDQSHNF
jgi:excinuclease UvrABC nuclease subunit